MSEEAEIVNGGNGEDDLNLLEKRAVVAKRKEKARKELMKVIYTCTNPEHKVVYLLLEM